MSSRPLNVIVTRGGAPVVAFTVTGMHQDHHPPRPYVGTPATYGSTYAFQATPNATMTHGTSRAPTQVQASGAYYASQITPQQPAVTTASGRSPALSPPAYPSPSPNSRPPPPSTPPSNPPYYRPSDNNRDRTDSRGFQSYAGGSQQSQGTNGGRQGNHAPVFAGPRVGAGTPTAVDADRGGRYRVGPERLAQGQPMARKYLDAAWGVTPGTKESLGLTD
ncbi:hypothetical protein EDB92DRAFT_379121 [Lactarius akahatsu]|uniref:Uncharacterized protein n=1 Tax=Lactarius akahatsu TaxID=416441 RepID=A0AAD4LME1_9AGAM|nr:hypothetical protein EDB92DRAFT_379121 [Lactarius akahatsu]